MDKVSVIVPVYNTAKYLPKCLESLIKQSYVNLEIVIVDDGSTDESLKICREYQKKNEKIKLIHKENGGLSDARNWGMKYSTGEYLTFVDSDDYLEQDAIKILMKLIKKYDADISLCLRKGHLINSNEIIVSNGSKMLMHVLYNSCFEAWGKIYKRELIGEDTFPVGVIHEDLYAIPQIIIKSKKCVIVHKGLYNYTIREDSIMAMVVKTGLEDVSKCCINNINISDSMIKDRKISREFQKWHYYHMLWYFYEILCNMDKSKSKPALINIAYFYKKTIIKYWTNLNVRIIDKFRFTFIALMPGVVRDYSVRKYAIKIKGSK